ncbi:MAG: hypothetical protein ACKVPY_01620 [Paracoccaceae bacterium]
MNITRSFLIIGGLYLLLGIALGTIMSGRGDFTLAPLHAHINLVGFVLMTLFGIVYHLFPAMTASALARAHFWLHQIGSLVLLVMLYLFLSGRIGEAQMVPLAPLAEVAIWLGVLGFVVNLWQNARA